MPTAEVTIDLLSPASFAAGQPLEQFRWLRANATSGNCLASSAIVRGM